MSPVPRKSGPGDAATVGSGPECLLEGVLLKRADRGFRWNERYFTFIANRLIYYHKRNDEEPKASFVISRDGPGECEVGALYIDQRQKGAKKQVLYCFKITWNKEISATDVESLRDDCDSGEGSVILPHSPGPSRPSHFRKSSRSTSIPLEEIDDEMRVAKTRPKLRLTPWKTTPASPCQDVSDMDERNFLRRPSDTISIVDDGSLKVPLLQSDNELRQILTFRTFQEDEDERKAIPYRNNYLEDQRLAEKQFLLTLYQASKKENQKKIRKRVVGGSKLAAATGAAVTVGFLTAGVGLLAGLVFLGASAAAGGTGVAAGAGYQRSKRRRGEITLASANYEEARKWKAALDACLVSESVRDSKWGQLFFMEGRNATTALLPTEITTVRSHGGSLSPKTETKAFTFPDEKKIDPPACWLPIDVGWATFLGIGAQGLRIFRAERDPSRSGKFAFEGDECAPLKTHLVIKASPLHTFMCLMSHSRIALNSPQPLAPAASQRASFRVLQTIDDNMDVIHLIFRPLYLFPSWTTPRDFVLFRYWRYEADGTYVVCYDSVGHRDCPSLPGYTRAEMHGVYTIAPQKKNRGVLGKKQPENDQSECLVTSVVQVNPKGWIPLHVLSSYGEAFSISALLQLLDIRDALDQDRFVAVSLDSPHQSTFSRDLTQVPPGTPMRSLTRTGSTDSTEDDMNEDAFNYDFTFAHKEFKSKVGSSNFDFASIPPMLSPDMYAEPDSNSFRVRGKSYKQDKLKINAGSSIGKLIAVDVVGVDAPLYSGFSLHPTERIQLALDREASLQAKGMKSDLPPFVFVVNIVLPGPPFYHGVFYYAIDDMSCINGTDGTASSKLCNAFFFGDSDAFRDKTFKLIPQIVEGNFLVRKAVGSTPAIMGTKLRQLYVQNPRFMEVILDCGSSSVATGVIRLSLGYAKTLVIDMGFLFEGNDETTLPERIFGAVRIKNLVFGPHLRKVEQPLSAHEVKIDVDK